MKKESIVVSAISFVVFLISIASAQTNLSEGQAYSDFLLLSLFVMLAIIILSIVLIVIFRNNKVKKKKK